MSHPAITIAEAVKDLLNATEFSQDFTAVRKYVPRFDTESGHDVQVQVVPVSDAETEDSTYATEGRGIIVNVGIMKRLEQPLTNEVAEIDDLMSFVQEVRSALLRERLGETDEIVCVSCEHEPIYSVDDIDSRVFITAPKFTFNIDVEV
jgi:hypothetical protein